MKNCLHFIALTLVLAFPVRAEETEPKPVDETGFCYRFLEVVTPAGEIIRRREVVLIKPSSSLEADLKRMQDIEEGGFGYQPGHMKLNMWHSGWFDGKRAYLGDKTPACSGLPTFGPVKP
jgi:hypothetical protein